MNIKAFENLYNRFLTKLKKDVEELEKLFNIERDKISTMDLSDLIGYIDDLHEKISMVEECINSLKQSLGSTSKDDESRCICPPGTFSISVCPVCNPRI